MAYGAYYISLGILTVVGVVCLILGIMGPGYYRYKMEEKIK
jgi:hypothetical protein